MFFLVLRKASLVAIGWSLLGQQYLNLDNLPFAN